MASWSDLMAVLFTFFVLLYAMAEIDEEAFANILQAFGNPMISIVQPNTGMGLNTSVGSGVVQMPVPTMMDGTDPTEAFDQFEDALRTMALDFETYFTESDNAIADQIEIELLDNQIILTFASDMIFASGSAQITAPTYEVLDYIASVLIAYPLFNITVVGHTDNAPISTFQFPSNWELSSGRSNAVVRYFVNAHGMDPLRIQSIGHGEYRPIAPNDTPAGMALNRRVEILITVPEI